MPRGIKKENLPSKVCVVCNRQFTWRKKWEKCWGEVTTCSKSCNRKRRSDRQKTNRPGHEGLQTVTGDDRSSTFSHDTEQGKDEAQIDDLSTSSQSQLEVPQLQLRSKDDASVPSAHEREDTRAARKAAKKRAKEERREKREGRGDSTYGQKQCDVCSKSVDLLVRCTVDQSGTWKIVCGKCWNDGSGGVVDGDSQHPHYRYGGLWKNRAKR